jgi:mevalonate kinase
MKFLVKNLERFTFNNGIHTNFTGNRTSLHVPRTNLSLSQQDVHYICIKVFNKLPKYVTDSLENKNQFIRKVKNLLLDQAFYSVNEFLNFNYDLEESVL